jgi:hypothetical protein
MPVPAIIQPDGDLVDTEEPQTTTTRPGTTPNATNPFGIPAGSSATPGVIAPVPQQQQQGPAQNRVQ